MPWTFAHPAAVLIFRRWFPARLHFLALVVGSLAPDFGYYVSRFDLAKLAHTAWGSLSVALPSGLVLLLILYLLREPLCFLLPSPASAALRSWFFQNIELRIVTLFCVVLFIELGVWTHIVWDSFTHRSGWVVMQLAFLQRPALHWDSLTLPIYSLLQHASTLLGVGILVLASRMEWRKQRIPQSDALSRSDFLRYALLGFLATLSFLLALQFARQVARAVDATLFLRVLVFHIAIYSVNIFLCLFSFVAIASYLLHRVRSSRSG